MLNENNISSGDSVVILWNQLHRRKTNEALFAYCGLANVQCGLDFQTINKLDVPVKNAIEYSIVQCPLSNTTLTSAFSAHEPFKYTCAIQWCIEGLQYKVLNITVNTIRRKYPVKLFKRTQL